MVRGSEVHLTGYLEPSDEDSEMDEEEDEEEELVNENVASLLKK